MHLILDAYCRNQELMREEQLLGDWLLKAAKVAEMTAFGEPTVVDYPFPGLQGTALSAVCFLGESSIVVHTYPEKAFCFIDIFSCKDFDADRVIEHIIRTFQAESPNILILERGVNLSTGEITPAKLKGTEI